MSRYAKGHKAETHRRVVEIASRRFRSEGVDGVGVASLMADAGLTHGGFYAHFASKEALVKEALVLALSSAAIHATAEGEEEDAPLDLRAYVNHYLSPAHRDRPGSGCAVSTLAPELARRPRATRNAFGKELARLIARLATGLPDTGSPDERQALAYSVFGQLTGTLQLARVAPDKALSDRILAAGRGSALAQAALPTPAAPAKADARAGSRPEPKPKAKPKKR